MGFKNNKRPQIELVAFFSLAHACKGVPSPIDQLVHQQVFAEHYQVPGTGVGDQGYNGEQDKYGLCPDGIYSLVGNKSQ